MKKTQNLDNIAKMRKTLRRIPHTKPFDITFRRIYYTRYADDFIVGITGPKELAERIKISINKFLKLKLKIELNLDKTLITKATKRTKFLGYIITKPTRKTYKRRLKTLGRTIRVVNPLTKLALLVDTKKIIRKLADKNYCHKNGEAKPNF